MVIGGRGLALLMCYYTAFRHTPISRYLPEINLLGISHSDRTLPTPCLVSMEQVYFRVGWGACLARLCSPFTTLVWTTFTRVDTRVWGSCPNDQVSVIPASKCQLYYRKWSESSFSRSTASRFLPCCTTLTDEPNSRFRCAANSFFLGCTVSQLSLDELLLFFFFAGSWVVFDDY